MIITLTPNPSIDRTCRMRTELHRGGVYRLTDAIDVAGGKGVNVANAIHLAGHSTLALVPVATSGRFSRLVRAANIPYRAIDTNDEARTNMSIIEPDGTTTKLNTPGASWESDTAPRCLNALRTYAAESRWIVLAGSLPSGVDELFYLDAISTLRSANPNIQIAVDTSDRPLEAIAHSLHAGDGPAAPDLMKPNGFELGQLADVDGLELEKRACDGDFDGLVTAARKVNDLGVRELLVTLGEAGALLVRKDEPVLHATSPSIVPLSTVGAGDSALAGYLLARTAGASPSECLTNAVAYGAAATALAGTTAPTPEQVHPEQSTVTTLDG